ncbi:hypothetical protein PGTUg99_000691 [Puccinia graminis f. sp. tritici]|uniref:Uncharacterized protein n=1 Tax=Puccinia graminis f. sp. tritici TaxID=56615 RepID=A0A5B0RUH6_PUCGR|nr:hypothetical protein PGTUg99_000691 [Puccinia graminis f. sp. tritici]
MSNYRLQRLLQEEEDDSTDLSETQQTTEEQKSGKSNEAISYAHKLQAERTKLQDRITEIQISGSLESHISEESALDQERLQSSSHNSCNNSD